MPISHHHLIKILIAMIQVDILIKFSLVYSGELKGDGVPYVPTLDSEG